MIIWSTFKCDPGAQRTFFTTPDLTARRTFCESKGKEIKSVNKNAIQIFHAAPLGLIKIIRLIFAEIMKKKHWNMYARVYLHFHGFYDSQLLSSLHKLTGDHT